MRRKTSPAAVPSFALYGDGVDDRFPDGLHIETIHARSAIHNWSIKPHRHHDLYQFFWIADGGGRAQIEDTQPLFSSGTAIVLPPLAIHGFHFRPGTSGFVVSIPASALDQVLGGDAVLRASVEHPKVAASFDATMETGQIEPIMQRALDEFQSTRPGRHVGLVAHAALIALYFARLKTSEAPSALPIEDAAARLARRYLQLIELHFRDRRALNAYARDLGISVPHMSRICRQALGVPALTLLHNRVVLEARRNLVYTSMTISQVAFGLGFSDPAYFTRFFTNKTGLTPSDCRAKVTRLVPAIDH